MIHRLTRYPVLFLLICFCLPAFNARAGLEQGASEQEMLSTLGPPDKINKAGDRSIFVYPYTVIELRAGKIVDIKGDLQRQLQRKKQTVKPTLSDNASVRDYRQGGKSVDINNLLVPGNVTVIAFYADW